MSKNLVLFGNIEFGDFCKGRDAFPCAVIYDIQCQLLMDESEADDFMVEHGYSGYLIPAEFKGEIFFGRGDKCLNTMF